VHNPQLLPYFIFGTLLVTGFALAVIISVVIQKQRQVKARLARQQMIFDHSQSLLHTRVEVRETTLNMLARELHDNITQAMTGCYMQVNALSEYVSAEPGRKLAQEAKDHLMNVIRDVRLLSHSLATGMVEQRELHDAIQAELTRIQTFTNIACSLEPDTLVELAPEKRLLLFRTVQEALQNTLKHADARHIKVHISNDEQNYYLTITDDGKGFDAAALSGNSFGLMSIKERIEMLQGTLQVVSEPGIGTTVKLRIPINQPDEKDTNSHRRRLHHGA
jgi:signal transduction histidine kinase